MIPKRIYTFEITNLETLQVHRFTHEIKQKQTIPLIGELQKRVCVFVFENQLMNEISEIAVTASPEGKHVTMKLIGGEEKLFVKMGVFE